MAYQDISLRSYELKGSGELINIMTLADVLSLNGTPTKDLPEGVNGILVHRKGGIALGDVHKYEVTEGEEQAWFEDSIRLAASVTRNIDRIGLPRGEFRKKYGSSHQSGSGALSRLARTAVSKAAGLLRPSGRE
jgi:D-serine deaminase-like pyridoxal phosphate-dependent protein